MAGNLNPCDRDVESFRFANGRPVWPGVFGAVNMPACLRDGLSGSVASENEESRRGEGWVEDLCPSGATMI
jgi:hypothetical protein